MWAKIQEYFFIIIKFSMSFKETVERNRKDETVKIKQLTDENEKKMFCFYYAYARYTVVVVVCYDTKE